MFLNVLEIHSFPSNSAHLVLDHQISYREPWIISQATSSSSSRGTLRCSWGGWEMNSAYYQQRFLVCRRKRSGLCWFHQTVDSHLFCPLQLHSRVQAGARAERLHPGQVWRRRSAGVLQQGPVMMGWTHTIELLLSSYHSKFLLFPLVRNGGFLFSVSPFFFLVFKSNWSSRAPPDSQIPLPQEQSSALL